MLAQPEIDHLELRFGIAAGKQKVLQLEIAVDNSFRVQVSHGAKHLLDQPGTLTLGVVIVRLLVQAIEEFSSQTQFLDQINLGMALVDFFQAHNIGVIELAHDEYFFPQLHKSLLRIDQSQIQALNGVLDPGGLVRDQTNDAGDARSKDRTGLDPIVDLLDGFSKGDLHVHDVGRQSALFPPALDHGIQSNDAGGIPQGDAAAVQTTRAVAKALFESIAVSVCVVAVATIVSVSIH
mmetsp:Transcript_23961/g.52414  ORF Transcript_23961/g.52414 Transcript_23961/m.52414 type:complete len:236 (+) Transcript_23961:2333-3040(+)